MIHLSNFSTLFELFAGINLAFIAVNYLNDYANILANKIFQINIFIESNFKDVLNRINELNQQLNGVSYKEEKYALKASKLSRTGETHIASLESKSQEAEKDAMKKCHFKTFSSTCLWSFLFCFFVLFISGYESENRTYISGLNIQEAIIIFSLFSLIFFIICWGFSNTKNERLKKLIYRLSYVLMVCVICFIISLIISLSIDMKHIMNEYFIYLVIFPVLIPCVNFIFFIWPTFYKINAIKHDIREYIDNFKKQEVKNFEEDVNAILKLKEWNLDIMETNEISFEIKGIRHIGSEGLERIESLVANEELTLIQEFTNPYDANAIAIKTKDNIRIGYVPKELTSKFKNNDGGLKANQCSTSTINYSSDRGYNIKVTAILK